MAPGTATSHDSILIWNRRGTQLRSEIRARAQALARALPDAGPVINLCADRATFLSALLAALMRRCPTVLPPSRAPEVVQRLYARHPGALVVVDAPDPEIDLPQVPVPAEGCRGPGLPWIEPPADQPAVVVFTSGTTGAFEAHPKTWGQLVTGTRQSAARLGIRPDLGIVGTVPPQHMYGLETTVLYPLVFACSVHGRRPLFPADVADALAEVASPERLLVTTPIHLQRLIAYPDPIPAIRLVLSATAPLSPDLARVAEARLGAPVREIYGCTEGGSLATRRTVHETWRWLDGVELITDPSHPMVTGRHLAGPTPLADELETMPDGTFRIVGRKADHVGVAGKRASLGDLNHRLLEIPGVIDGTFIAPSESDTPPTARLAALYVSDHLEPRDVLTELARRIDPAFLPRPLRRVPCLPRSDLGKLQRSALCDLLQTRPDASRSTVSMARVLMGEVP